jgi:hypothetical protein
MHELRNYSPRSLLGSWQAPVGNGLPRGACHLAAQKDLCNGRELSNPYCILLQQLYNTTLYQFQIKADFQVNGANRIFMNKTILVVGSTGQQGSAVTRKLLSEGYPVKAMTRDPDGPCVRHSILFDTQSTDAT